MSRYHSYLNSAVAILGEYRGNEPFSSFLKKYFSVHKKFGSKDRKQVSHLCYCYFRLGKAATQLSTEEKILAGLFLCSNSHNELLEALQPDWNSRITDRVEKKLNSLHLYVADIFPMKDELSPGIDVCEFSLSFFTQPDLFLRLRPGKEEIVRLKLENAGIPFTTITGNCLALPNNSRIDDIISLDKEAVVQDYSSQLTGSLLQSAIRDLKSKISVWDCCAASGGKSIMAIDILGDVNLAVSDVRNSILSNLKKRFTAAGIKNYQAFTADLTATSLPPSTFNLIICDAPCTGSGTWGRTPEQLYYFDVAGIKSHAALQKKIATNALKSLFPGGYFLYITCSVFKEENEEVVDYLLQNNSLTLLSSEVITGYNQKADTMFAALIKKEA